MAPPDPHGQSRTADRSNHCCGEHRRRQPPAQAHAGLPEPPFALEARGGDCMCSCHRVSTTEDYWNLIARWRNCTRAANSGWLTEKRKHKPPHDPRLDHITVTPDPRRDRVNLQPAQTGRSSWPTRRRFYDEARLSRLVTEKIHDGMGRPHWHRAAANLW